MATKDVKENRHLYIGGSDIAKVMGLSRWGTPLSLWAEKTGKILPKDLSNVEAVELGNDLEDFVANKFSQKTGKAVRRSPKVYQHPQYPYMVAHIDRLVTGTDELLECKTCSFFKKEEWEGEEIPQEYILQVIWYLGITGRKKGWIAVLIGGQSFKYKHIDFDSELFDKMVESAKDFWQHVQDDTPVDIVATDDETLKDLYSNHSEIMIDLIPTDAQTKQACDVLEEKVGYLQEIKMHIKQLQDEQKEIETSVKDIIKDNLGIKTPKYIITWKNQTTTKFDTVKLRQERPETFEDYSYESSYRVMRISKNKEVA